MYQSGLKVSERSKSIRAVYKYQSGLKVSERSDYAPS